MRRLYALTLPLFSACFSSTLPEYQEARTAALAPPPPLEAAWQADAAILLSRQALEPLTYALLTQQQPIESPLVIDGLGRVIPDLSIERAIVGPSTTCDSCLAIDATLDGVIRTEGLLRTTAPVRASLGLDVEIQSRSVGPDHVVELKVRDVRNLNLLSTSLPRSATRALSAPLLEQAKQRLLRRTESITLAKIPSDDLPIRAVRVGTQGRAVRIELRTQAREASAVQISHLHPRAGWTFVISSQSLTSLARAESMRQGPVSYDVVPEPTAFRIDGRSFEMDLRLWKTTGQGWWRDYTITGALTVESGKIAMTPAEVRERHASPGAAVADPLAYLGSSVILSTIRESLEITQPALHQADLGAQRLQVQISSVEGRRGDVIVQGHLTQGSSPRTTTRGGARPR
ncbi:MAG: hypothetical protein EA397_11320 [Deltaproteobacteria bacterium]|nr:MAG: hypothetical protein EA397_11320 [Deltaproteobacteria bacterium]